MSEVLGDLRRQARALRLLARDLSEPPTTWSAIRDSTHLLGPGAPVDAWYLAEHFFRTWANWHGLRIRYGRYFNMASIASSTSWERDDRRYAELARLLWSDLSLQQLIAHSWREDVGGDGAGTDLGAGALFHGIISSHEALSLVTTLSPSGAADAVPAARVAQARDQNLKSAFDRASGDDRHDVIWQLRNYRRATLQVSWLADRNGDHDSQTQTSLEYALAEDERAAQLGETLVEPLLDQLSDDQCRKVLKRIVRAVSEVGYEYFFDDAVSREMAGGSGSPLGAADVQVVPRPQHVGPGAIVLALSRRGRRGASLANVLAQINELLADVSRAPRAVVLLSDTWDAEVFTKIALSGVREHHARGVAFVFLLVGSPQQVVSPVPVLLNGRPLEIEAGPIEIAKL